MAMMLLEIMVTERTRCLLVAHILIAGGSTISILSLAVVIIFIKKKAKKSSLKPVFYVSGMMALYHSFEHADTVYFLN
jgi:high-affinity Fe2+/Pb2+ permease